LRIALLPPLPTDFDIDISLNASIVDRMYANDEWGDCVVAGRAHHTMRFELFEQKELINILDSEVLQEYWKEQGDGSHPDNGLVMLNSLNSWRRDGWTAGLKHYDIYAFAEVDCKDHDEVKYCTYLLYGSIEKYKVDTYKAFFRCVKPDCGARYEVAEIIYRCRSCGSLLEVSHDLEALRRQPPRGLESPLCRAPGAERVALSFGRGIKKSGCCPTCRRRTSSASSTIRRIG
jgi:hypothetical protein